MNGEPLNIQDPLPAKRKNDIQQKRDPLSFNLLTSLFEEVIWKWGDIIFLLYLEKSSTTAPSLFYIPSPIVFEDCMVAIGGFDV